MSLPLSKQHRNPKIPEAQCVGRCAWLIPWNLTTSAVNQSRAPRHFSQLGCLPFAHVYIPCKRHSRPRVFGGMSKYVNEALGVAHSKRCPRIIKQEICLLFNNVTQFLEEVLTSCSLMSCLLEAEGVAWKRSHFVLFFANTHLEL